MSAYQEITVAALETQAFSLMGRMHVILRRQNGRVTDIEYMRNDPGYCRHLLDMASQLPNDDLKQICERLREIYFGPEGLFVRKPPVQPLLTRINMPTQGPVAEIPVAALSMAAQGDHGESVDRGYIGRLR